MKTELKTGNVALILAALATMKHVVLSADSTVTVSTDTSEIDALHAEMLKERDKHLDFRSRDRVLHAFQAQEYSKGAWHYQLSSNIYGWCVGESLRSNMGGGRWAVTARGATLEECIVFGCTEAARKNVRFSFSLKQIPSDHNDLAEAIIGLATA